MTQAVSKPIAPLEVQDQLQPLIVRASAGTGKTYRLTARLLRILLMGASPETIVASTFTRKAAGEILSRVLGDLAKATHDGLTEGPQCEAVTNLRQQVELDQLPVSAMAALTKKLLFNIHRIRIGTLDSLFAQFAKAKAADVELPLGWRIADEIESKMIDAQAIDQVVALLETSEIETLMFMLLGDDAKRSIAWELDDVVRSGYTASRGLSEKVWHFPSTPSPPGRMAIEKALETISIGVETLGDGRITPSLASLVELLQGSASNEIYAHSLMSHIAKALQRHDNVTYHRKKLDDDLSDALKTIYALGKTDFCARLRNQNEATGRVLNYFQTQLRELQQVAGAVTFDDVTESLVPVMSDWDYDAMDTALDGSIQHLLLDEFQDTSPMQWKVLLPIAKRVANPGSFPVTNLPDPETVSDSAISDRATSDTAISDTAISDTATWETSSHLASNETEVKSSFFCVGDTKQAIYGWRGGVAEIFDSVAEEIPHVGSMPLNASFRSSPVVIDFVNKVFKNLRLHRIASAAQDKYDMAHYKAAVVRQFAEEFPVHQSNRPDLRGRVDFRTAACAHDDEDGYWNAIVDQIESLHREMPDKSIGVLVRRRITMTPILNRLKSRGLAASEEGGNPLTDSAAVQMVLSALMSVEHPGDRRWAFHVSQSPLAAEEFSPARLRRRISDRSLATVVRELAAAVAPLAGESETLRLKQLVQLALANDHRPFSRLRDFVDFVAHQRVAQNRPAPIQAMTIHASKGLEFDAVVLPELDGQLIQVGGIASKRESPAALPTRLSRYVGQKNLHFISANSVEIFGDRVSNLLTEALCLWYVALTRAKSRLLLLCKPVNPSSKTKTPLSHASTATGLIAAALGVDPELGKSDELLFHDASS